MITCHKDETLRHQDQPTEATLSIGLGGLHEAPLKIEDITKINTAGNEFKKETEAENCLVLSGRLGREAEERHLWIEEALADRCLGKFGYPQEPVDERTISVILDSAGGSLDSAYKIIKYLSRFAANIQVFIPKRAKSASTLIAIGANELYMSPFAELGPLDSQIQDPRNPNNTISVLDCYRSVDYVKDVSFEALKDALWRLSGQLEGRVAIAEILEAAAKFAAGVTNPILTQVKALDFGAWGRSLNIGERYAQLLRQRVAPDAEQVEKMAFTLVYGYTHHLFPIDIEESKRIGLNPRLMTQGQYESALKTIEACHGGTHVTFVQEGGSE